MTTISEQTASNFSCRQISLSDFLDLLCAQGVAKEHCAYKCVKCGHIQSAASLSRYITPDVAINVAYRSCEGCYNSTVGCDWTLGGLFQLHKMEVLEEDNVVAGCLRTVPVFEPATPEEAQALMQRNMAAMNGRKGNAVPQKVVTP